ncbi:MAG TPA: HAMP domain-containing sensor histidine kinase [Candidatus Paceibacterota bacterium]|nr:HAMP domain-containing sensor histidine kinase [Candidatus Paceibacterota bacterium]
MTTHPSLRPYVAWATDLIDKYRFNPYYKTTTHVVGMQTLLGVIKIALFLFAIYYIQKHAVEIVNAYFGTGSQAALAIAGSVETLLFETFVFLLAVLIALNVAFGFLISRFALYPARSSLQFQKRFIGNIAHEIRTPLAIIKTNTEVALFDEKLPAHVRETFTDTIVELDRISETINNLLSFDTLTRPRRIEMIATDLGAIAETCLKRHQALADSRGVALVAKIGDARMVHGNGVALEQVVTNLVKNAINYTPKDQGGTVTVRIGRSDDPRCIELSVKDTGIGIEQKDLYHIFEPFYRGDTSRARGIGTGTSGLGLAIVNEIVRLHRGSVAIASTPGAGTEITITLPKAKGQDLPEPLADNSGTNAISVDFS